MKNDSIQGMRYAIAALLMTALVAPAQAQNSVVDWSIRAANTAVAAGSTIGVTNIHVTYVNLAVYNALNAIERRFESYGGSNISPNPTANKDASVISAAFAVLANHFPAQIASLTAQYDAALAAIPDGTDKTDGILVGQQAAAEILNLRANDGLSAVVPYTPGSGPGVWVPTPPAFAPAQTPQVGQMAPFTMTSASQFLPDEGPTPLDSQQWADDYNRTKLWGAIDSPVRTPEQTDIGRFWTANGAVQYTHALAGAVTEHQLDLLDTSRLYTVVFTASSDAFIGCMNAKYTFNFWRPITAIRAGDTDGNAATEADASWTPLATTPNHPEYPAAHGCYTGAATTAIEEFFGTPNVHLSFTSSASPNTHSFDSTRDLLQEVEVARIYGGMHFHHSIVQGAALGQRVAHQLGRQFFQPIRK